MIAACSGPGADAPVEAPAAPPDILLVVLDTVRADRTSAHGYERRTTPQLESVAAAGVAFDDATAPGSWTWPSHASLFTGQPPWAHGARLDPSGAEIYGMRVGAMRTDLPTLAERLGAAGYRTEAACANPWLDPALGLTRGFERVQVSDNDADALAYAAQAIAGSEGDPRPLFLFVNLMAAHMPYSASPAPWVEPLRTQLTPEGAPEWALPFVIDDDKGGLDLYRPGPDGEDGVESFVRGDLAIPPEGLRLIGDLYDAEVMRADYALNKLLRGWPGGVVAVTSDHGEHLGERGLMDHGKTVYPQVTRIPMVLHGPGVPRGERVASPVQLQALYPTLLELAGVEDRPRGSLLRLLDTSGVSVAPIQAAAWPHDGWADSVGGRFTQTWRQYREGDRALIAGSGGDLELYDLSTDPQMFDDLAAAQPDLTAAMAERAATAFPETASGASVELSAEAAERLRILGYVE